MADSAKVVWNQTERFVKEIGREHDTAQWLASAQQRSEAMLADDAAGAAMRQELRDKKLVLSPAEYSSHILSLVTGNSAPEENPENAMMQEIERPADGIGVTPPRFSKETRGRGGL